jgi:hypothetical protein
LTQIESEAFSYSSLQSIIIPCTVEVLCSACFSYCKSLSSVSFESDSRLTRIESEAFSSSSLQSILIQFSVEVLCSACFGSCESLSSVLFESNPQLMRIESHAFDGISCTIVIPCIILFIASNVIENQQQPKQNKNRNLMARGHSYEEILVSFAQHR